MKVMVTGRTGQLSRCLSDRCARIPGLELIAIGRPDLDLEDPGSSAAAVAARAPDIVINAAAYTNVDQAEDEPERAMRVNAEAAEEIAAAAAAAEIPVVQISTDYVFDGNSYRPYREEDPTAPLNTYGRSKLAGEALVRAANPRHLILRTGWVYSPYGKNFLKTMLRLFESQPSVSVVADQRGNPTSAHDLADAILAILKLWIDQPEAGLGQIYHMAGSGTTSWFDFASAIYSASLAGRNPDGFVRPVAASQWPTKARRPACSALNSEKFARDFGYRSPPWQESCVQVVETLRGASCP